MFFVSRFVEDGVNFSINSDDPLVCQTRVDLEQGVAFNKIGLTPAELTQAVCYFVSFLAFAMQSCVIVKLLFHKTEHWSLD